MGTRRPIRTGEVDSLNRPVSVSGQTVESRATAPSPVERVNVLQPFRPVGFERRICQAAPDALPQPGGSCWHCGAAIINCVIIRHNDTGETVTVGLRCAERVGLTAGQVSEMLAEFYAGEHARVPAGQRAVWEAERAERDRARLERVRDAASRHGTVESFEHRGCRCDRCLAAVDTCEATVLVEVDSGRPLPDARMVHTRFGSRWVIDRDDGEAVWLPVSPARRQTLAGKGYVEAAATFRRLRSRQGDWFADRRGGVLRLSESDAWDAPVAGAVEFNVAMAVEADDLPDWLEPDLPTVASPG